MAMTASASALWEKGTDRLYGWLCWDSGSKAFRDGPSASSKRLELLLLANLLLLDVLHFPRQSSMNVNGSPLIPRKEPQLHLLDVIDVSVRKGSESSSLAGLELVLLQLCI
ncbi:uncharacterized protein CLUP02_10498 [Colletotrichum lupini]|uniref:Uncharacterized protein n=1 Tax=Colletotrichum lupini TaxID=145971 RepID=A0A9Q8SWT3_9PEZI|nr:uncharacterized protein CLUP02_10498 [Colletotrichum lupini]UQC85002.1 hypothetical protein CLUP02_10498 [Colletotrichum lupini]